MPLVDVKASEPQWTEYDREFLRQLRIAVPSHPMDDADLPYVVTGAAMTIVALAGLVLSLRQTCIELF